MALEISAIYPDSQEKIDEMVQILAAHFVFGSPATVEASRKHETPARSGRY